MRGFYPCAEAIAAAEENLGPRRSFCRRRLFFPVCFSVFCAKYKIRIIIIFVLTNRDRVSYTMDKDETAAKADIKKESYEMEKYICSACGYIYDPAVGDPDNGVAPGTAFEAVPDDWTCPLCGVGKDMFTAE